MWMLCIETGIVPLPAFSIAKVKASCFLANSNSCSSSGSISIGSGDKLSRKPDSITAEYGLSIRAEGNLFVANVAGEGSLKVTFAWSPDKKG